MSIDILTLNIGSAAAPRAAEIDSWLSKRSADVVVLTETSAGAGTQLLTDRLRERGYDVRGVCPPKDRGALVASRLPVVRCLDERLSVSLPWRACSVVIDTDPQIAVIGVYVPSRDRTPAKVERKREFIASLLRGLQSMPKGLRSRSIVVGDYNVVARDHTPPRKGYFPYEYEMLEALSAMDLRAAHEILDEPHPHSWIGRTGDGYLYDYIHLGSSLHECLGSCQYVHDTRELRLSDHAAVTASIHAA